MKKAPLLLVLLLGILLTSCSSVRVAQDYDQSINFNQYDTFAFFKPGIDQAEISDLDKKRILRAIESELMAKGLTKSENPDLLVSIFTKSSERVDVYNNWGWGGWGWGGWGWGGWGWGGWGPGGFGNTVSRSTQGTLYIDLVDAGKKELIWQGQGTAALARDVDRKQERINEIVNEIMAQYPPAVR
ncbi:DUF4136 domain-containing protein [Croceiramulus getboli]|nr:DUF4136 domain-containing protein [Flavobacteriaceae bacterium YJPT1-3]